MNPENEYIDINKKIAYSVKQIALLTSISKSTIFNEISNGNLKIFKCGRRTLATRKAIDEWIEKLSNAN